MNPRAASVLLLALCLGVGGRTAHGQRVPRLGHAPAGTAAGDSVGDKKQKVPWYAPLASLAVPGLGQALLRENRALLYVSVEVYSLLDYRAQQTEAARDRDQYIALANDVARRFFSDTRPVGPWSYYESMEKYIESGAFDRIPGGGIDPEIDESTYNGSIWKLARDTYWPDPNVTPPVGSVAYTKAVSMYLQRAARSDYLWSWRDAALEHDLYRRSIRRSNDASRRAREQAGVLLANHLLSMVDAFATIRLRYLSTASSSGLNVEVRLPWPRRN